VISLDANVLIYAIDVDANSRHARAKDVMNAANRHNTALTEQAIFEFFHASTRKGKLSSEDATIVSRGLTRNFSVLLSHSAIVDDAFVLQSHYRLSIWDARLLAVCAAHGCDHLLSEDLQDGAHYGGVTAINPFNPANARLIGRLLS
jgi:predicted nucleic acid-binding protein